MALSRNSIRWQAPGLLQPKLPSLYRFLRGADYIGIGLVPCHTTLYGCDGEPGSWVYVYASMDHEDGSLRRLKTIREAVPESRMPNTVHVCPLNYMVSHALAGNSFFYEVLVSETLHDLLADQMGPKFMQVFKGVTRNCLKKPLWWNYLERLSYLEKAVEDSEGMLPAQYPRKCEKARRIYAEILGVTRMMEKVSSRETPEPEMALCFTQGDGTAAMPIEVPKKLSLKTEVQLPWEYDRMTIGAIIDKARDMDASNLEKAMLQDSRERDVYAVENALEDLLF
jgi:hypothetical protein